MADKTTDARQQVVDARRAVDTELDRLGPTTRAALDIPAKVRRHPLQTVGVAGGAAFLIVGGPRRVLKGLERRFLPERANRPPSLLPKDVDKTIKQLPREDREQVRAHLERDFASYLQKEHPKEQPDARQSFWKTYDILLSSVGARAGKELTKRLFEMPKEGVNDESKDA